MLGFALLVWGFSVVKKSASFVPCYVVESANVFGALVDANGIQYCALHFPFVSTTYHFMVALTNVSGR